MKIVQFTDHISLLNTKPMYWCDGAEFRMQLTEYAKTIENINFNDIT